IAWFHISASKANFTCAVPLATGGSWKKSPVTMTYPFSVRVEPRGKEKRTWIPPNGTLDLRRIIAILASLSNKSLSTMETGDCYTVKLLQGSRHSPSSIMSTLVRAHRVAAFLFFRTFETR
ncbi:hypothetical protein EV363DRAFT_1149554, partial [Boletus edulis]